MEQEKENNHENEEAEKFSGIPSSSPLAMVVFSLFLLIGIAAVVWIQMPRRAVPFEEHVTEKSAAVVETGSRHDKPAQESRRPSPDPDNGGYQRRLVFTDGKKTIRHPNGLIEVPVVFSCEGAGIEPFWVYGDNPEEQSAKELKAREEWFSLYSEAKKTRSR